MAPRRATSTLVAAATCAAAAALALALPAVVRANHVSCEGTSATPGDRETVFETVRVEYDLPAELPSWLDHPNHYIPEHCVIAGVKVHGDDYYVTTPRWWHGVPITLGKLSESAATAPHAAPSGMTSPSVAHTTATLAPCAAVVPCYIALRIASPHRALWLVRLGH